MLLPFDLSRMRDTLPSLMDLVFFSSVAGFREEAVQSDEGDQGSEARPQYFRWRERRSSNQSCQGAVIQEAICLITISLCPFLSI